jgi:hypothetical protein
MTHLWKGAEMVLGATRACADEVAACPELTCLKTDEGSGSHALYRLLNTPVEEKASCFTEFSGK